MHLNQPGYALLSSLFILSQATAAFGTECSIKSGAQATPLLELYTSEGCSSCPPADQWLSGITAAGFTSGKVVPLAFHVDYWDYIGWKDRFGKLEFSARQRQAAKSGGSTFVYTPQVMLNSVDFRGWQQASRFNQLIDASLKQPAKVAMNISMAAAADGKHKVTVSARGNTPADTKNLDAYIAVYENNLSSEVTAGENSGRQLRHDYVVRELLGPYPVDEGSGNEWRQGLTLNNIWKNREIGIAAFVQNRATGLVLQALSLKSCF